MQCLVQEHLKKNDIDRKIPVVHLENQIDAMKDAQRRQKLGLIFASFSPARAARFLF